MGLQQNRKMRSDSGVARLNTRDIAILRWIGEQYAIRLDDLQRLLGERALSPTKSPSLLSKSRTRHIIERWISLELVEQRKIFFHDPSWVWLTAKGLAQLELPYKPWSPKAATLAHLHAINAIRMKTQKRHPEANWISERMLRNRLAASEKGSSKIHLPDAEVLLDGQSIAVEVELSQKEERRLTAILRSLTDSYKTVWYFTVENVSLVLKRARESLATELQGRVKIYVM